MKRAKVTAISAVAASSLLGVGLTVTQTAYAGTNGQQLRVCADNHNAKSITVKGHNQNGKLTEVVKPFGVGCTEIPGYWWVGTVNTFWSWASEGGGLYNAGMLCVLPKEQAKSDFFECRYDSAL